MSKYKLQFIAGCYINRTFDVPEDDAQQIYNAINQGSEQYSSTLHKQIASVTTASKTIRYRSASAKYENHLKEVVEISGYANISGWGFRATAGSEREENFNVIDNFLKTLGAGFSQLKKTSQLANNGYHFIHQISNLVSLVVFSTTVATLENLIALSAIIARSGLCEIYEYQLLNRSIRIINLTNPINLKFLKIVTGDVSCGDILCEAGSHKNRIISKLIQLGYEIVAEKEI